MNTSTKQLTASDVGCYVDSTHGIYGTNRVCALAKLFGWNGLPDYANTSEPLGLEYAYEAQIWLNKNVATEGCEFGWCDGEFHYQTEEWWQTV